MPNLSLGLIKKKKSLNINGRLKNPNVVGISRNPYTTATHSYYIKIKKGKSIQE